jgi:hypothetical protein
VKAAGVCKEAGLKYEQLVMCKEAGQQKLELLVCVLRSWSEVRAAGVCVKKLKLKLEQLVCV